MTARKRRTRDLVPKALKRPHIPKPVVRLCMSRDALSEFQLAECGRWEDHGAPPDEPDSEPLAYNILGRFKTMLLCRNQAEVDEIWWALCSGSFQVHRPRAAMALAKRLRPFVNNKALLAEWPYPTGD